MSKVIVFASPKGGVGKSTEAVHQAVIAARDYGKNVLVVDADPNDSAYEYADRGTAEAMPFDIAQATGSQAKHLAHLRRGRSHDLTIVDLPGARESGALQAMLRGDESHPVPDLLLVPSRPRQMDLKPTVRALRDEVIPLGVPYLIVFTMVKTSGLHLAQQRQLELRQLGFKVANTVIREYVVYDDAYERDVTVLDLGGQHSYARVAETEQRALAYEALSIVGLAL